MKKFLTLIFAIAVTGSLALAQANTTYSTSDQSTAKAEKKEAKAADNGKTLHLTGWVKNENGKTVFVNDKDKQAWNVSNPDALSGHDGEHVRVRAKLDESSKSVTISKVKKLHKGKQTGAMKS